MILILNLTGADTSGSGCAGNEQLGCAGSPIPLVWEAASEAEGPSDHLSGVSPI